MTMDGLLIDNLLLIGRYQMIAGFLGSAGLALEAPIEKNQQAFYRRISHYPFFCRGVHPSVFQGQNI